MPSSKKSTHGTGPAQNGANPPMDAPEPEEPHDDVRTSPNERRRSAPRATDGPKVAPEPGGHKRFSARIGDGEDLGCVTPAAEHHRRLEPPPRPLVARRRHGRSTG